MSIRVLSGDECHQRDAEERRSGRWTNLVPEIVVVSEQIDEELLNHRRCLTPIVAYHRYSSEDRLDLQKE